MRPAGDKPLLPTYGGTSRREPGRANRSRSAAGSAWHPCRPTDPPRIVSWHGWVALEQCDSRGPRPAAKRDAAPVRLTVSAGVPPGLADWQHCDRRYNGPHMPNDFSESRADILLVDDQPANLLALEAL